MDDEIKIFLIYPRLDVKVSETINHLLKAPFCIHPKSSKIIFWLLYSYIYKERVCVPFTYEDLGKFNPLMVPSLEELTNPQIIE